MKSGRPHNLFFVTEVPKLVSPVEIIECGCCGGLHRVEYDGDCRNNNERFFDPEDAETRLGVKVLELPMR